MLTLFLCSLGVVVVDFSLALFNDTVDIGYDFDAKTLYWPGMPSFQLSDVLHKQDPYMLDKKFAAAEHGGTHLDAPLHFNPNGWAVADIPINRLLVEGVMVDLKAAAMKDADAGVTVSTMEEWERSQGPLPDPVVVIFNFGWAHKYPNKTAYFGMIPGNGNESNLHFPGVSREAAEWMVKSGKVVGVGVDTPSIDRGNNTEFIAHQLLTAADIYLLENLALAEADLPARGFKLTIMPMKIMNGTGAPLRIFAQPKTTSLSFFSMINVWFGSCWGSIKSIFV